MHHFGPNHHIHSDGNSSMAGRIRKGIAAMASERSMDIMSDKTSYSKKKKDFLMQSNTSLHMFKALLLVLSLVFQPTTGDCVGKKPYHA
ncbi:hypothetical protein RB195_022661 [Necator americanus]|uniref:Uncharacterized protein n=1 Tax=Necator americanus TaxID=51031 RepID=A0ABR1EG39_NECAM